MGRQVFLAHAGRRLASERSEAMGYEVHGPKRRRAMGERT